ncbi:MAG: hypothetical protein ACRD4G_05275 [Bryobacteraceae bacterium]
MRRSGNHACVGWLVNALEGCVVNFVENSDVRNFNYSDSGRTCFINDVSTINGQKYIKTIRRERRKIEQAQFIVISAEDEDSRYAEQWRIPHRSETILVRRNALNLMASRFQNLNRRARQGLGISMQSMDARFFTTLSANLQSPRGTVWELERWHCDPAWRKTFLASLGLEHDIAPPSVGLGSSFTQDRGLAPTDQLNQRFAMVEPRDAWMRFIRDAVSRHPGVFSPTEQESVRAMVEEWQATPSLSHA